MLFIEDLASPSCVCVHFLSASEKLPLIEEFTGRQIKVFEIQGAELQSEDHFFTAVSSAMSFPEYFSPNWNALNDCLRDLGWHKAEGYVLALHGAEDLWRCSPRLMGAFVETWLFAAEEWARRGTPFHLLFVW